MKSTVLVCFLLIAVAAEICLPYSGAKNRHTVVASFVPSSSFAACQDRRAAAAASFARRGCRTLSANNIVDDFWSDESSPTIDDGDTPARISRQSNDDLQTILNEETDLVIGSDSADSTKVILLGGTGLVLVAAGALSVTLGNDLGIDLELG